MTWGPHSFDPDDPEDDYPEEPDEPAPSRGTELAIVLASAFLWGLGETCGVWFAKHLRKLLKTKQEEQNDE